ncbi:hypothetical protein [Pseudoalteromonas phenolica]|uniref:Lipoprotein n=1 Tax=Pseudoalteromonas phenolica TaxID=161398 RepID=A0A0S2JWY4_9GAMM|nr:hypothetical protein [Pseudoalteromonas phenolica]ALO40624.1 hypothetical protein PP2015_96 [Pseudoalteromonas phenolica]MBE0354864.1 hypothetical protein [Pseudoalteromonas phenolica O-BC30]RXF01395.1 hypothetical protein D9981_09110 [Pseudoalteromonas phenolica O-BC30]
MKKQWNRILLSGAMIGLLTACHHTPTPVGQPDKVYDFDHKVHYEQTKFNDEHYFLKIRSDAYAHFTQQSVFLLRHSEKLCQGMNAQLTLQKGVQAFERLPTHPRAYQPDLQVEVKCVSK